MRVTDKYTLFVKGPFSQWHASEFVIDGQKFVTAEQYMMYSKAMLFNDVEVANAIMRTNNPMEQKALGRKVRNFDADKWNAVARDIVYKGNMAKFSQNEDLRQALLDTEGTELVEAAWYDPVWGIGLREDDPLAWDKKNWRGTNWLGETLTRVREDLKQTLDTTRVTC